MKRRQWFSAIAAVLTGGPLLFARPAQPRPVHIEWPGKLIIKRIGTVERRNGKTIVNGWWIEGDKSSRCGGMDVNSKYEVVALGGYTVGELDWIARHRKMFEARYGV